MLHAAEGRKAPGLEQALSELPRSIMLDQIIPMYDDVSPTGVALLDDGVVSSIPDNAIIFCPRLAAKLGLHQEPTDPWAYYNESGEIGVQSLWWREGGLRRIDFERSIAGTGFVVSIAETLWPKIETWIEVKKVMQIWRSGTSDGKPLPRKLPNGRIVAVD